MVTQLVTNPMLNCSKMMKAITLNHLALNLQFSYGDRTGAYKYLITTFSICFMPKKWNKALLIWSIAGRMGGKSADTSTTAPTEERDTMKSISGRLEKSLSSYLHVKPALYTQEKCVGEPISLLVKITSGLPLHTH